MEPSSATLMRLRRLRVVHEHDPDWPVDPQAVLPGILQVTCPGSSPGSRLRIVSCPDALTLVTSLWNEQPYGARGQMLRPVTLGPSRTEPAQVRLEVAWASGFEALWQVPLPRWQAEVSRLAGQVAEVLVSRGERALLNLLAPALAGAAAGPGASNS